MDASSVSLNRYVTKKKALEIIRGLTGAFVPKSVVCMHLENDVSAGYDFNAHFVDRDLPPSCRSPTRSSIMASWRRDARGLALILHTGPAS
jgi:hypothetical protein